MNYKNERENVTMKILEDYKQLVGKTVAFAHMAQFAEYITIATTDGCVIVATQDLDEYGEGKENRVLYTSYAIRYIENNKYIREELGKLGIFDVEEYKNRLAEIERKRREEFAKKQAKIEREQYERLKAKFENS